MTHDEWKDKWLNKRIDYDGRYGAQCVDTACQYMRDVHDVTVTEGVNGAVDFFVRHDERPHQKKFYFAIKYQEGLECPQGALVVWGATPTNKFGHIAICDSSTQTGITVLEQDGFDNPDRDVSKGDYDGLEKRTATYDRILGWLVLKQKSPAHFVGGLPPPDARIAISDRNAQLGDYWFNPSTQRWMLLALHGWSNI